MSGENENLEDKRKFIEEQERLLKIRMGKIRHKVSVISGKGRGWKEHCNSEPRGSLRHKRFRVGILDADIHGPSIPKMLGLSGNRLEVGLPGVFSAIGPFGIRVVSMDFLLPNEESLVIWRGPLKMAAIRQFLSDIVWGELDLLLIDLPPGTGDEPLSIAQLLPDMDGVIIITIPSEVSQLVVKKAVNFARTLGLPVIGIIENMGGFICPNCGTRINIFQSGGGEKIAKEMSIPFLGRIPIDQRICENSDKGKPFIIEYRDSPSSKAFIEIVKKIEAFLNRKGGALRK